MKLGERLKIIGISFTIFSFVSGSSSVALAKNNNTTLNYAYVGFAFLYNSFGGEFDGKTDFDFGEEIILVPKVQSDIGFGALLGLRHNFKKNNSIGVELGYNYSAHDNARAIRSSVFSNMLFLDTKYYFSANRAIQPFLNGEIAFSWLRVEEGSVTSLGPPEVARVGDASFCGLALGIGGGIAYYPHPKISINLGIIFRWLMLGYAKGELGELYDINTLNAFNTNITVGITYTFWVHKRFKK